MSTNSFHCFDCTLHYFSLLVMKSPRLTAAVCITCRSNPVLLLMDLFAADGLSNAARVPPHPQCAPERTRSAEERQQHHCRPQRQHQGPGVPSPVARAVGMQHINSCEREEPQGRIPASVRSHSFHPCEAACWQAALRIGR